MEHNSVHLCAVWRCFKTKKIIYHILDPDKDSLTPISLEMLTEELPRLLQTLLISVEHTINRVPFDELSFPQNDDSDDGELKKRSSDANKLANKSKFSPNGSPKCGLKRREIITKSKSLHGRYALRRFSNKNEMDEKVYTDSTTVSEPNIMPLFCLGGSFPHIDSDEDSADDGTKTPKERK